MGIASALARIRVRCFPVGLPCLRAACAARSSWSTPPEPPVPEPPCRKLELFTQHPSGLSPGLSGKEAASRGV